MLIKENGADDSKTLRVQLVKVSKNDIRLGVGRLRHTPGVATVEVVERKRSVLPSSD